MLEYMLFRTVFAFLDYDSPTWLIILKNLAMLKFWVFLGSALANICRRKKRLDKASEWYNVQ